MTNLTTAQGLMLCEVAEHDGDWASAAVNFRSHSNDRTILLKCDVSPVLREPREFVEALAAATAASVASAPPSATRSNSCCSVEEGKSEMKDLLHAFLGDFKRVYGDTFGEDLALDIPAAPASASPNATPKTVPDMPLRPGRPPRPEEGALHPNIWCDLCGGVSEPDSASQKLPNISAAYSRSPIQVQ